MSRLVPQSPFFALLAFASQLGVSLSFLRRLTLTGSGHWLYGSFWTCAECMDGLRELRLRGKASWQPILSKELLAKMTCDSGLSSCGTELSDRMVGLTLGESMAKKPLFPSLTTFKVDFEDKLPTPSLRHALDDMVASRSESRTVDGWVVARLAHVEVKTV
ncbi:hypothetical protein K523DRAFT_294398 [Schizophyllum commune Tattone D]|nr:hypothetical protein K523DRAFT_294398 [Schizophyllum commune Tattone D]